MPFDHPHYQVRVRGHFGASGSIVETFQWGFKLDALGADSPDTGLMGSYLSSIAPDVQTLWTTAGMAIGSNVFLTSLTIALIGEDGFYINRTTQPTTVFTYPSPVAGSGTPVHPWATSWVCSLRTSAVRGLASNGRIYFPSLAMTISSTTGQMTSVDLDARLGFVRTMLNAASNKSGATLPNGGSVCVASKGGQAGPPITRSVIGLRSDGRPDHNETREKQLVSAYRTLAL